MSQQTTAEPRVPHPPSQQMDPVPLPNQDHTSVSEFAGSLPQEYRARFNPAEIAMHAHIAMSRQERSVHAGLCPVRDPNVSAICIAAQDRPGLLSLLSSALTELNFDVVAAEAYARRTTPPEALDVFWIRDPKGQVTADDVEEFANLVRESLAGTRPEVVGRVGEALPSEEGTTVRFREDADGALCILEVETGDRSGLLWAITRALTSCKVQITGSRVLTQNGRCFDSFTIEELTGEPIGPERRLNIQVAVLTAIETPNLQ